MSKNSDPGVKNGTKPVQVPTESPAAKPSQQVPRTPPGRPGEPTAPNGPVAPGGPIGNGSGIVR